MRHTISMTLAALAAGLLCAPGLLLAASTDDDMLPASFLQTMTPRTAKAGSLGDGGILGLRSSPGLLGIDSIQNWSSYFYRQDSVDGNGYPQFTWPYTMVGRSPYGQDNSGGESSGGTTVIPAPIIPVIVDLRNFDGSPRFVNGKRLISDPTKYVQPVLKSPVFSVAHYDSSKRPTQISDAIFRAQFFNDAEDDWQTLLAPTVKTTRTMTLIRGHYSFALNADGTCCAFILVEANAFGAALFPPVTDLSDNTTVIGQAELSGDITTHDLATFLFPDTYLFVGSTGDCCILGYHTYDLEQGDASNGFRERRFVLNYSSWVSPGIFGGAFQDVTALSHEIAETYFDPFGSNLSPWWLAPNGNCQNSIEVGDVIEGLSNGVYPMTMNGMTYHPQNEALLSWFAGQTPSSAIHHAYSYPNTGVLTSAAASQNWGCN